MAELDDLNEGADNLRGSIGDLKDVLNELAISLNKSANLTNDLAQNLQNAAGAGEEAAEAAEDTAAAQDKSSKNLDKIIGKNKKNNALLNVGKGFALAFATQLGNADKETTQLGRSLNLSKGEAVTLKKEFAQAALNAGDIALNSIRLAKANTALNAQLGTAFKFSADTLGTFSKLTEIVGVSDSPLPTVNAASSLTLAVSLAALEKLTTGVSVSEIVIACGGPEVKNKSLESASKNTLAAAKLIKVKSCSKPTKLRSVFMF